MKSRDSIQLGLRGPDFLNSDSDLAKALQVSDKDLMWFRGERTGAEFFSYGNHYVEKRIKKARGGTRLLLAPKPRLKAIQRWILGEILEKIEPHPAAHGFRKGRSILTNASMHVEKNVVVCLDMADFFPTITKPRVCGLFEEIGYKPEVARTLALLCTTRDPRKRIRTLPQGAPTSPAISNLITWKLDARLTGLAKQMGFTYSRYADDCAFSGKLCLVSALLKTALPIFHEEGFKINQEKFRIHRKGSCQRITGLVVNKKVAVPRSERRKLRAILHKAKFTGLPAQNAANHPHFEEHLRGKISFVHMVNRDQAQKLERAFDAVRTRKCFAI